MNRFSSKGYLFLLPALIFTILFVIYPLVYNVEISFKDVKLISLIQGTSQFVGLENYKEIVKGPLFLNVALNTLIFTVFSIFFQFIIGFLIALLFNREFPLKGFLLSLIMLPWFIPILVSGLIFRFFFADAGMINNILLFLKFSSNKIHWITSSNIAIYSVTIANIWLGIPFNFILLYTGLKGIPEEIYEAAEIDGANNWKKTLYLTVPLLKPVINTTLILGAILTIKVFDLVWIITRGGPGSSSHLFSTISYQSAFVNFNFGLGAAFIVIMILIIIVTVGVLNLVLVRK